MSRYTSRSTSYPVAAVIILVFAVSCTTVNVRTTSTPALGNRTEHPAKEATPTEAPNLLEISPESIASSTSPPAAQLIRLRDLERGIYLAIVDADGLAAVTVQGMALGHFALGEFGTPAISPDLTTLGYDTSDGRFAFLDLNTGVEMLFEPFDMSRWRPSWSPRSHLLAVNGANLDETIQPHIGVIDRNEMSYTRLTDWDDGQHWPSWSPNGKWIAFSSDMARDDLARDLYLLDTSCLSSSSSCADAIEGPFPADETFDYSSATWSPDSRMIAFSCSSLEDQEAIGRLCVMDLPSRSIVRMLKLDQETAQVSPRSWSPDGRWLAIAEAYPARTAIMDPTTGDVPYIIDHEFAFWIDRRIKHE